MVSVTSGVPQGSVLWPLTYNVLMVYLIVSHRRMIWLLVFLFLPPSERTAPGCSLHIKTRCHETLHGSTRQIPLCKDVHKQHLSVRVHWNRQHVCHRYRGNISQKAYINMLFISQNDIRILGSVASVRISNVMLSSTSTHMFFSSSLWKFRL